MKGLIVKNSRKEKSKFQKIWYLNCHILLLTKSEQNF